jgi:hypothetical protein
MPAKCQDIVQLWPRMDHSIRGSSLTIRSTRQQPSSRTSLDVTLPGPRFSKNWISRKRYLLKFWWIRRKLSASRYWSVLYLSLYDIMTHSHFDTWHHNKISKARRANNMTRDSKSVNLTRFEDFRFATFLDETHLIHMTTSEESLRVLFFTRSLAVDLVH